MKGNKIIILVLFSFALLTFFLFSTGAEMDIGYDAQTPIVKIETPPAPAFSNNTGSVNSSDYWDALDTPDDIFLSDFGSDFVDQELNMNNNILFDASVIKPSNLATDSLVFENDGGEVATIDNALDAFLIKKGRLTGGLNAALQTISALGGMSFISGNLDMGSRPIINAGGVNSTGNVIIDSDTSKLQIGADQDFEASVPSGIYTLLESKVTDLSLKSVDEINIAPDGNVLNFLEIDFDKGSKISAAGTQNNLTITATSGVIDFDNENLSTSGNMTADKFIGDGSLLTNVPATDLTNVMFKNDTNRMIAGNITNLTSLEVGEDGKHGGNVSFYTKDAGEKFIWQSDLASFSIGLNTQVDSDFAFGFGDNVIITDSADNALAMGYNAYAEADECIAMGIYSNCTIDGSMAIGMQSKSNGPMPFCTALGFGASCGGTWAVSVGSSVSTNQMQAVALGFSASATAMGAVSIGNSVANSNANTVKIGRSANDWMQIGSNEFHIGQDNEKIKQGTGKDVSAFFDSADWRFNAEVGSPNINFTGFKNITTDSGFQAADYYAGDGSLGLTGNYSVGECWQYFTDGLLTVTNCTTV